MAPWHDIYRQWWHKLQRTWIGGQCQGPEQLPWLNWTKENTIFLTCVSIISNSLIGSAILDWSFDATVWHIETNCWYNILMQQDKCHRKHVKCKCNYLTIDEPWWYMHWISSNHNTHYIWCYCLLLSDFQQNLSKLVYSAYNTLFTLQRQIAYILITQMPCDMVNKKLELQRIECATSYT